MDAQPRSPLFMLDSQPSLITLSKISFSTEANSGPLLEDNGAAQTRESVEHNPPNLLLPTSVATLFMPANLARYSADELRETFETSPTTTAYRFTDLELVDITFGTADASGTAITPSFRKRRGAVRRTKSRKRKLYSLL